MIFGINTTRDISKLPQISLAYNGLWNYVKQFWNITRGIYAKYHYKSCYYLYKLHLKTYSRDIGFRVQFNAEFPRQVMNFQMVGIKAGKLIFLKNHQQF